MEDYLTMEEFERLSSPPKQEAKPIKFAQKIDYIGIISKFFKGVAIILKLIGFGLSKMFKSIYNGLVSLNEGMEKMKHSEFGKKLKEQQSNQPQWNFGQQPKQENFMNQPKQKNRKISIY